jgi:UDP-N-acetylglucosamine/UDP-N-acetylgalactosamine diphosphorylase
LSAAELEQRLMAAGQEHLVQHLAKLPSAQQKKLRAQLAEVDLELLKRLSAQVETAVDYQQLAAMAEPPVAFRLPPAKNPWNLAQALAAGRAALDSGQVGVLLVAGGQGSRLGFEHPKGMFPIGPVSSASLYQILCQGVLATSKRHQQPVPLYVMTSSATHEETEAYLKLHKRFGLPAKDVKFFMQGMLPAVDPATGQVLLASPEDLALSPDGHGGLLGGFVKHGLLDNAEQRGLRYLYYLQVDNPLVHIGDPEFLGYHILSGSEMSTQVIAKRSPTERVGNVVTIGNDTQIIEYSDLPAEQADRKTKDGEPIFWAGSIAVHVIDVAFLRRVANSPDGLPFHRAHKKVSYFDPVTDEQILPEQPNALKFERFIFDLLPLASEAVVMEVDRAAIFAPVKNADEPGALDTPTTVKSQMSALYRTWLHAAGIDVNDDIAVEINPLAASSQAEFVQKVQAGLIKIASPVTAPLLIDR